MEWQGREQGMWKPGLLSGFQILDPGHPTGGPPLKEPEPDPHNVLLYPGDASSGHVIWGSPYPHGDQLVTQETTLATNSTGDPTNTSELEYILIGMFGSIVGVFVLCQVVMHVKNCSGRRYTWKIGRKQWWNVRKRHPRKAHVFRCGLPPPGGTGVGAMWGHQYDAYEVPPCRPGLAYAPAPGARISVGGGSSSASSEQGGATMASRSSKSTTTVFMVDPRGHYSSCVSTPNFNMDLMEPSTSPGSSDIDSSSSSSFSSSSDATIIRCHNGKRYNVQPDVHCQNPGYDTDSSTTTASSMSGKAYRSTSSLMPPPNNTNNSAAVTDPSVSRTESSRSNFTVKTDSIRSDFSYQSLRSFASIRARFTAIINAAAAATSGNNHGGSRGGGGRDSSSSGKSGRGSSGMSFVKRLSSLGRRGASPAASLRSDDSLTSVSSISPPSSQYYVITKMSAPTKQEIRQGGKTTQGKSQLNKKL